MESIAIESAAYRLVAGRAMLVVRRVGPVNAGEVGRRVFVVVAGVVVVPSWCRCDGFVWCAGYQDFSAAQRPNQERW